MYIGENNELYDNQHLNIIDIIRIFNGMYQDMLTVKNLGSRHPHQLWLHSQTWKILRKVKADFISDEQPQPTWDVVITHLCNLYENSK
jgi:hypothetical protein